MHKDLLTHTVGWVQFQNILFELSEFPSTLILFCDFILNTLIHKYIGKNFSAPKNDRNSFITLLNFTV